MNYTINNQVIKFRGYSESLNEWVYGNLIVDYDGISFILWHDENNEQNSFMVDTKSIGQYIGLKDKSGKEIYKGDICRLLNVASQPLVVVDWDNDDVCYIFRLIGGDEETIYFGEDVWTESTEKVGNKFENPELLEVEMNHEINGQVIKFRGFSVEHQKWVYGSLIQDKINDKLTQYRIVYCKKVTGFDGKVRIEFYKRTEPLVYPESIGQYIMANDKNDRETYVGDIVKVVYHDDPKSYYIHLIKNIRYISDIRSSNKDFEVVGNQFKNKELLEDN